MKHSLSLFFKTISTVIMSILPFFAFSFNETSTEKQTRDYIKMDEYYYIVDNSGASFCIELGPILPSVDIEIAYDEPLVYQMDINAHYDGGYLYIDVSPYHFSDFWDSGVSCFVIVHCPGQPDISVHVTQSPG